MIYFLRGEIHQVDSESVVIDVNDVGYQVLVSHANKYEEKKKVLLYTYNVVREDENYLIGFSDVEERNVFLSLI